MYYYLSVWLLFLFVFSCVASNLLLSLVVLEFLGVMMIVFSTLLVKFWFCEYVFLILFSIFVMEGVIGLVGFITLVFFSGTDYLGFSSLLKI